MPQPRPKVNTQEREDGCPAGWRKQSEKERSAKCGATGFASRGGGRLFVSGAERTGRVGVGVGETRTLTEEEEGGRGPRQRPVRPAPHHVLHHPVKFVLVHGSLCRHTRPPAACQNNSQLCRCRRCRPGRPQSFEEDLGEISRFSRESSSSVGGERSGRAGAEAGGRSSRWGRGCWSPRRGAWRR